MKPRLIRVGAANAPVVVIDGFSGDVEGVAALADALAPFPPAAGSYYPGLRRLIGKADGAADGYVERTCRDAAQFIAGAFDIGRFDLLEASFSMVTTAPSDLSPPQRAPHFDSPDPNYLALLHFLRVPAGTGTGTAFYRQRSTGIEQVTEQNVATFVRHAEGDAAQRAPAYINASDAQYEQIAAIEAVPDRMLIYQGSLLHSGVIPTTMVLSADPGIGRLTANIFVLGRD